MLEIFRKVVGSFAEKYGYALKLWDGLLPDRVVWHAEKVKGRGALLLGYVWFVDCSNILTCRPGVLVPYKKLGLVDTSEIAA